MNKQLKDKVIITIAPTGAKSKTKLIRCVLDT